MRIKGLPILLVALAVLLGQAFYIKPAWAIEENIRSYRGLRSLGMGGIVVTTGRYGEALFGNPATQLEDENWKVTLVDATLEINENIIDDYRAITDAKNSSGNETVAAITNKGLVGRLEHTRLTALMPAYYTPRFFGDNTSFAFGLLFNTQANIMLRGNAVIENQTFLDAGPNVGVAHRFFDGALNLGVNLHLLYRLGSDQSIRATSFIAGQKITLGDIGGQGIGIDGDIGGYYKLPFAVPFFKGLSVGASVNNVAASEFRIGKKLIIDKLTGSPPPNARTVNAGVRADIPDLLFFNDNLFAFEVLNMGATRYSSSFLKRVHFGGETRLIDIFSLRMGANQGYIAGGIGVDLPIFKLDLATYGEEMGTNAGQLEDRRYAVRIGLEI